MNMFGNRVLDYYLEPFDRMCKTALAVSIGMRRAAGMPDAWLMEISTFKWEIPLWESPSPFVEEMAEMGKAAAASIDAIIMAEIAEKKG